MQKKGHYLSVYFVVASIFLYACLFFCVKREKTTWIDTKKSGWLGLLKTKAIILQSQWLSFVFILSFLYEVLLIKYVIFYFLFHFPTQFSLNWIQFFIIFFLVLSHRISFFHLLLFNIILMMQRQLQNINYRLMNDKIENWLIKFVSKFIVIIWLFGRDWLI